MDLSGFTTPKPERGTPARGTHVSSGQATPAQGSTATPAVPLCGTEARIAKQAQRREAREAERRAKRALLSTPPALPADAAKATPSPAPQPEPQPEPAAVMPPDGKPDPKTFIEMTSDAVPDMSSDSKVLDITEMVFPDCFTADLLEESNLTDVMAHNFLNERFDYPEFNKLMNVLCNTQAISEDDALDTIQNLVMQFCTTFIVDEVSFFTEFAAKSLISNFVEMNLTKLTDTASVNEVVHIQIETDFEKCIINMIKCIKSQIARARR